MTQGVVVLTSSMGGLIEPIVAVMSGLNDLVQIVPSANCHPSTAQLSSPPRTLLIRNPAFDAAAACVCRTLELQSGARRTLRRASLFAVRTGGVE